MDYDKFNIISYFTGLMGNPLCVLRYSATHREKQNLVYRLTPVDAYQMGLVKQISVISNSVINDSNKPYIALKDVSNANGFSAKIEIDVEDENGHVTRKVITVKPNDDLFMKSGHRKIYDGYVVAGIDCTKGFEGVEFANSEYVALGKAIGSVDENVLKRAQIYQTIKTHLDKELRYFDKGIKVLSLFFIDEVKKYRQEDGSKGIYAEMFEECYNELINKPKYAILKTKFDTDVNKAHNGYFSQDKLNKRALLSPEFMELWNKIKQKTTYRVQFDLEKLIADSIKDIREMPEIASARLLSQTASVDIQKSGVTAQAGAMFTQNLEKSYNVLPDILRLISTKTLLKRSTVNKIIQESGRAGDFLKNPQDFYEKVLEIIQRNRHALAIDGIKYIKLAGEEYAVQEIFSSEELIANLDRNAVAVKNSVYDYVIYDSSTVEKPFAVALDEDPDVKMFFKIPSRFKIDTPIGTYNPDWAVYLEKNGEQKLYFVLETKGTDSFYDLRPEEQQKIHCGAQHFKALDNVIYSEQPVRNWQEFKKTV